ncbi:MAG: amino acid adenylation domain-containing protein, partial [Luteimonas sp.]
LRARLLKMAADEHILLVTLHHIASDGWSMAILITEFSVLYRAYALGQSDPLPPLAIQYADYAHWQRNWLQGDVLEQQLGYWTKQLASLPVVHSLPLDRARPAMQSFQGAICTSRIDAATSGALNALCQASGATLFMGLHAAFSVLLARYSDETDIVVGSPIANREQAEVASLIGFFVNTLILRSDLSGNPSFTDLLGQSKTMLLDAYAHQQVPFEQLVERLQPQRSLSHSPLFQIMLVLQNNEDGQLDLPGLTLSPVEQAGAVAKYDLTLNISESAQGLALEWEYSTDLFEATTMARLAGHFEVLLRALVSTPGARVGTADMLGAAERHQLLVEWNDTAADYPRDTCIHELFEARVAATPDAVAVVFEGAQLSYGELNAKANRLAHYLVTHRRVKPDTLVGICVERSLEMMIGILGILKAGAAYVPLDPAYPEARLAYMLADAAVGTVLTQARLRARMPFAAGQAVCLDGEEFASALSEQAQTNPDRSETGVGPAHLAYVIYTSGSTGQPKGVMIEHRNTVAFLAWARTVYDRAQLDCVLASTSVCFDLSIFEMFAPLSVGGTTLIVNNILDLQPGAYSRDITLINTVPSAGEALLSGMHIPPSVKTINLAGEPLKQKVVDSLYERGIEAVYDLYGPSEDTTYSTYVLRQPNGKASIGKPIHNSQVYVLNRDGQPVPHGIAGELHIGGAGLARGYLNRPELTREKFIVNPFHAADPASGARLYKTGDLVRWLADGNLEYLGRIDHQVKIRGFRIELGEIENALTSHARVNDAVVLARDAAAGDKRLVAYVVTHDAGIDAQDQNEAARAARQALIDALRRHLAASLPDYMMPAAFVLLASLPLSPNGKIDRKALPEPDAAQQATYVAPRTQEQRLLCALAQEVLGVELVGITDNFFQLGGHSLTATRLVARINQAFKVVLPLRVVFQSQTLEALAREVAQLEGGCGLPPLQKMPQGVALLPSYAQQRLWLLDRIDGGSAHYNMPAALKLEGALDQEALDRAFTTILARHESLRTCFIEGADGQPLQVIQAAAPFAAAVTDLSALAGGERQVKLVELLADEAGRAFDLGRDRMLRARLLKVAAGEHILLVTMHHIASDGWSLAILINEFSALYRAYALGQPDPLPPLTIQYADYAHWQRNWLQGEVLEQQLGYWTGQLASLPVVHSLPLDRARPAIQSFAGERYTTNIDAATTGALNALCQASGATLFMGLHAAFSLLLARYSRETDIVVGSSIANREQADVAGLIGFFVNTLILRSDLSGNPSFIDLLGRSKAMLLDAYAHQQVPFEQIVERLQPERS